MINPFQQINWHPKTKDLKSFGNSMVIGFAAIAVIFFIIRVLKVPAEHAAKIPLMLFSFGAVMWMLTRMVPSITLPVYFVWFFISACIGLVISNLILTIFFYLIFTPFAIGIRIITRRDPLQLKRKNVSSFWCHCRKDKSLKSFLKQY